MVRLVGLKRSVVTSHIWRAKSARQIWGTRICGTPGKCYPVRRTSCSASILVPRMETLGMTPRAMATSSQR